MTLSQFAMRIKENITIKPKQFRKSTLFIRNKGDYTDIQMVLLIKNMEL